MSITQSASGIPKGQKMHACAGLSIVGCDVGLFVVAVGGGFGIPIVGGGVSLPVILPGVIPPGVGSAVGNDMVVGAVAGGRAPLVNTRLLLDFQKITPPTDDIEQFFNSVKPIFERAAEDVLGKKERDIPLDEHNSLLPTNATKQKGRKKCDDNHNNES
jgi:hypothetical protein